MIDYIKWIREKVGHDPIILNFSSAIIVNEKNEILLQKRYKDKNIWGIIGGIMNYGESSSETVIREAKEETNLDIDVDYLIGIYSKYFHNYENGDVAQTFTCLFKATVIGGNLQLDGNESHDLKYFSKDNLPTFLDNQHEEFVLDYFKGLKNIIK